ncbi:MAG TPA: cytidine deaminase [Myxococcota bacterium]|nr:cytidine deaminase [Myxococcota bacterium]
MDKKITDQLLKAADEAREHCYAPYSNYRVGCAVLLEDGSIVTGVNIENAAYGVVLCAERSAMASVISNGRGKTVKALAVVTNASPPGSPCGMCRQFLSEFVSKDFPIVLGNGQEVVFSTMGELLPFAFDMAVPH